MEGIILSIGTPAFSGALFDHLRDSLSIRHLVIYRYERGVPVDVVLAQSANDDETMRRAIGDYSAGYYRQDPLLSQTQPRASRVIELHHVQAAHIADAGFRSRLYEEQRMASKTAIVIRRPTDAILVGMFRPADAGDLAESRWQALQEATPLIAAAVERHADLSARAGDLRKMPDCPADLGLSAQEQTVCNYILQGYFNEGIALNMGISVHTVVTYRRRAFRKLGISTQNELFHLILAGNGAAPGAAVAQAA